MLYTKNGSIPKPETDGTDGWIEVDDAPEAPEGKEVVWWYPPGWVIRDPQPVDEEGYKWSWSQSSEQWVKYEIASNAVNMSGEEAINHVSASLESMTSSDLNMLSTASIGMISTASIDSAQPQEGEG